MNYIFYIFIFTYSKYPFHFIAASPGESMVQCGVPAVLASRCAGPALNRCLSDWTDRFEVFLLFKNLQLASKLVEKSLFQILQSKKTGLSQIWLH